MDQNWYCTNWLKEAALVVKKIKWADHLCFHPSIFFFLCNKLHIRNILGMGLYHNSSWKDRDIVEVHSITETKVLRFTKHNWKEKLEHHASRT